MINIAFLGNPNVGKSALINKISNSSLKIGNWPGVTIERKEVFFSVGNDEVKLVDLPGIYNLSTNTAEERVSRDYLLGEKIDIIINVVDSTSLEKNLYLTALLKELNIPIVMALNFFDEFEKLGYSLNKDVFEKQIGVSSVFTSGKTGEGINDLIYKAVELSKEHKFQRHTPYRIAFDDIIENEINILKNKLTFSDEYKEILNDYPIDWVAIKTLEEDFSFLSSIKVKYGVDLREISQDERLQIKQRYDLEPGDAIARARYATIRGIVSINLKRGNINKFELTDKIDRILLNRFFGGVTFMFIIYAMFIIIFDGAAPFLDWVDGFFSNFINKYTAHLIEGVPNWLNSLILDGILGSLGGVLTFVPLMMFIYLFMSLLEESGYMARVAFIMNKSMTKVGLSGKAFIPMLIGFGCTVPAIYSTRTLEDEKTRRLTASIATFMSCGARLPVYSMIAAAFFNKNAAIVVVSIYFIGVAMSLLGALFLKRFKYFKGDNTELLIELPPYRLPSFKVIWSTMINKTMMYVKRATTVVLGILLIIWVFTYFPNNGDINSSFLAKGAKVVQPIFKPTGFADKWQPVASLVPSIIAKETVVAFFGQVLITDSSGESDEKIEYNVIDDFLIQLKELGNASITSVKSLGNILKFRSGIFEIQDEEALDEAAGGDIIKAVRSLWGNDSLGKIRAYSFMLFVLLVVPCAVALGALKHEFGWKMLIFEVIALLILPYVVSTLFFNIARLFI